MTARADMSSITLIKGILDYFASVSSLVASESKSQLFYGGILDEACAALCATLGMTKGLFPFRYLGVPWFASRLTIPWFRPLVKKITQTTSSWSSRFLSYAAVSS
ncbi:hypothetical protein Droror1_Dr00025123 [Drosera rotundifolia]